MDSQHRVHPVSCVLPAVRLSFLDGVLGEAAGSIRADYANTPGIPRETNLLGYTATRYHRPCERVSDALLAGMIRQYRTCRLRNGALREE